MNFLNFYIFVSKIRSFDQEWENKVWKDAWASRETIVDECLEGAKSSKRKGGADTSSKRIKRDESGVVWGKETTGVVKRQEHFLFEQLTEVKANLKQSTIKPITGVEWFCRQILKEVTGKVVDICQELEGVAETGKSRNHTVNKIRKLNFYSKKLWRSPSI